MQANWKPIAHETPGTTHYKRHRAEAFIHRQDGQLTAEMTTGLFGLGNHVETWHRDSSLSDEVVLARLDEVANPPRYDGWKEVRDQEAPGVTHYEGRETGGLIKSKVDCYITRSGDEVSYKADAGVFGTHHEGVFFSPVGDQEVLRRLSQKS